MPETTLPRHISSVATACEEISAFLIDQKWATEDIDRAVLAVGEAVSNAIEHGKGRIQLKHHLNGATLTIEVADEGSGPTMARVKDARLPDDMFDEGGRGLFILQALSDSLSISDDGGLQVQIVART